MAVHFLLLLLLMRMQRGLAVVNERLGTLVQTVRTQRWHEMIVFPSCRTRMRPHTALFRVSRVMRRRIQAVRPVSNLYNLVVVFEAVVGRT